MAKNPNRYTKTNPLTLEDKIKIFAVTMPLIFGIFAYKATDGARERQEQHVSSLRANPTPTSFRFVTVKSKLEAPGVAKRVGVLGFVVLNVCKGTESIEEDLLDSKDGEQYTNRYMEILDCNGYDKRKTIVRDKDGSTFTPEKDVLYILNDQSSELTPLRADCNPTFAFDDIYNCTTRPR